MDCKVKSQAAQFVLLKCTATALSQYWLHFSLSHWKMCSFDVLVNSEESQEWKEEGQLLFLSHNFFPMRQNFITYSSSFTLTLTFSTKCLIQDINNLTMLAIYDLFVQLHNFEKVDLRLCGYVVLHAGDYSLFSKEALSYSVTIFPLLNRFATRPFGSFVCPCSQRNSDFQLEDWWLNFTLVCLFHWRLFKEPITHWKIC